MNRPSTSNTPRKIGHWSTAIVGGGAVYFLIVFGVGFTLGVVRTLWLVPRLGVRWAELLEIPVMLAVIYWAARWVSRRFRLDHYSRPVQVGAGLVGFLLLLGAKLGLALQLGGQSAAAYVASRDPVSGTVYAASFVLYAVMPTLVTRNQNLTSGDGKRSQGAGRHQGNPMKSAPRASPRPRRPPTRWEPEPFKLPRPSTESRPLRRPP